MHACAVAEKRNDGLPSVCDFTHQCGTCLIQAALAIQASACITKEGMNQCKSAHRLVDTGPVTGASPVRNSNTARPDGQWFP